MPEGSRVLRLGDMVLRRGGTLTQRLVQAVISVALRLLYRRADAGEDVSQNLRTFEACRRRLLRGRCVALFPEGLSHNAPKLRPVKTGAARIALGAAVPGLKIVPVGLYYTSKTSFRGEALLRFGESLDVPTVEPDEQGEPPRDAVRELSARIEEALLGVTLNAETEEQL